eukprot:3933163-Rhodomonas_salina.1
MGAPTAYPACCMSTYALQLLSFSAACPRYPFSHQLSLAPHLASPLSSLPSFSPPSAAVLRQRRHHIAARLAGRDSPAEVVCCPATWEEEQPEWTRESERRRLREPEDAEARGNTGPGIHWQGHGRGVVGARARASEREGLGLAGVSPKRARDTCVHSSHVLNSRRVCAPLIGLRMTGDGARCARDWWGVTGGGWG